ncbi:hypothetical protein TCAL_10874 [Tigriopus californicus]|uniref:Nuclear receptor domain-containing protein n=1 Tax=Tigriopus californicus TaxID=6832 RepID=A0A553P4P1_TIGCA|nr:uncharacterized protein LOC131884232 [Tigriopus californicus]TRY72664.1 hypothetical protein TCAL_10874 [Tigriopus californicus]|eukprot:TCALIF_10874-PA protein Name:"Similar to NR5A2 Nuclear receptor subfamily 5 group A member 2 (Homo sapiens)" AED:0.33 eAED:0.37 QI:0/-1/0/1/-1/1/1/0/493
MDTLFQRDELDILLNEILSDGSSPFSEESVVLTDVLDTTKRAMDPDYDVETTDLQDLIDQISEEELSVGSSKTSNNSSIPCQSKQIGKPEDSSDSSDATGSPNPSKSPSNNNHLQCPVCGHLSGKHSYYGAQVCFSCRSFFRRSTINSTAQEFGCKNDQNCEIDSKSWKSCKFCRYQKCLSAGMKPNWVLNDEDRTRRNAKRSQIRKARDINVLPLKVVLEQQWTTDEENQIRAVRDDSFLKLAVALAQFYENNPTILDQFVDCVHNWTAFDSVLVAYIRRFICTEMMKSFSGLLALKDLSPVDRFLLLSHNYSMWVSFEEAVQFRNYHEAEKSQQTFLMCLQSVKSSSDPDAKVNVDMLQTVWAKFTIHDNVRFLDRLNDLVQDQSSRKRRTKLITSIQSWPRIGLQGLSDDIMLTLMMMILLCCPDSLHLQSEGSVSQIQNQYCYMLYRYTNFKYPGQAHSKLGEGMDIVSKVREVTTIGETALNDKINRS